MRTLARLVVVTLAFALVGQPAAHALGDGDGSGGDSGTHISQRDIPAFQSARNRQVQGFSYRYARLCPSCSDDRWYTSADFAKASGRVKVDLSTYKILDQNDRYDFFAVDATASLSDRTGDEDWGWMDFSVRSIGKVKILNRSYSLGKHAVNTTSCNSYPIDLGLEFYFVSAGTEVGKVQFCNPGSEVRSSEMSRGRFYHATGVSGIAKVEMQRYVMVRQGKLPRFRINAGFNHEAASCANVVDGYHCWINRAWTTKSMAIGTARQQ